MLELTMNSGSKINVFGAHIRSLRSRPSGSGGALLVFSNGDTLAVTESRHEILNMLDYPPSPPQAKTC